MVGHLHPHRLALGCPGPAKNIRANLQTPQTADGYAETNEPGQRLLGLVPPFEQQVGRSTPPRPVSAYDSVPSARRPLLPQK
jgi:hypothetical protein